MSYTAAEVFTSLFGETSVLVTKQNDKETSAQCCAIEEVIRDCEYFMVFFGAAWCEPCVEFTQKLKRFYEKYHHKRKFDVIFFSRDHTEEEQRRFVREKHPEWWVAPHALCRRESKRRPEEFNAMGIPAVVIFRVVWTTLSDGSEALTPQLMTTSGRAMIEEDPTGRYYPWEGCTGHAPMPFWPLLLASTLVVVACVVLFEYFHPSGNANFLLSWIQNVLSVVLPRSQ